jgi:hypothetical protein
VLRTIAGLLDEDGTAFITVRNDRKSLKRTCVRAGCPVRGDASRNGPEESMPKRVGVGASVLGVF